MDERSATILANSSSWLPSLSSVVLVSSAALLLSSFFWGPSLIRSPKTNSKKKKKKSKKNKTSEVESSIDINLSKKGLVETNDQTSSEPRGKSRDEAGSSAMSSKSSVESTRNNNEDSKTSSLQNNPSIQEVTRLNSLSSSVQASTSNATTKKKNKKKKKNTPIPATSELLSDKLTSKSPSALPPVPLRHQERTNLDPPAGATSSSTSLRDHSESSDSETASEPGVENAGVSYTQETSTASLDDGWEMVSVSKGKKKTSSASASGTKPTLSSLAPDQMTKKQRENLKKAQRIKEEKEALDELQRRRLAQHRKEQEASRLAQLAAQDKQKERAKQFARNFTQGNAPVPVNHQSGSWFAEGSRPEGSSSIWD